MKRLTYIVLLISLLTTFIVASSINTLPVKWRENYIGMEKSEVIKKLGDPDAMGFEEYYWISTLKIFDVEILSIIFRLDISPGQDTYATPYVVSQYRQYSVFGGHILGQRPY